MHPLTHNPAEVYRRVELDARIEGSDANKLAHICFEAVVQSLAKARFAALRDDHEALTDTLSRVSQIILGLEHSLDDENPMSATLREFYGAASLQLRQIAIRYNDAMLITLREDFIEVMEALDTARLEGAASAQAA